MTSGGLGASRSRTGDARVDSIRLKPRQKFNPLSRAVHFVDSVTSRSGCAAAVATLILLFFVVLAIAGYPEGWQTGFATVCAAVTTIMVFTIQHKQSREQAATQLKLDELIRVLPDADDHLVHVEWGADEELEEIEQRHVEHHLSVRAEE